MTSRDNPDDYSLADMKMCFGSEGNYQNADYYNEKGEPFWHEATVIAFAESLAVKAAANGEAPFVTNGGVR